MSDDLYDDMSIDELEDELRMAKEELESARRHIGDIEDALYDKRDKPIMVAKRKLANWTRLVQG